MIKIGKPLSKYRRITRVTRHRRINKPAPTRMTYKPDYCTPYILDSPSSINTRQRGVQQSRFRHTCLVRLFIWWITLRPAGCASSQEIPLASEGRPQAFTPLGVGLLPGACGAPFKGNADWARGIFRKCQTRVGCDPEPGPSLKRSCTVFLRLVGRMINTDDPDPHHTITCNTTCVVDNSRYPTGLSVSYKLTTL